jgi:hypothetical protein
MALPGLVALLCAMFLVSPNAFDHDIGALVVAAAIILTSRSGLDRASGAVLTAVAVPPAFVLPLGYIGASVASVDRL